MLRCCPLLQSQQCPQTALLRGEKRAAMHGELHGLHATQIDSFIAVCVRHLESPRRKRRDLINDLGQWRIDVSMYHHLAWTTINLMISSASTIRWQHNAQFTQVGNTWKNFLGLEWNWFTCWEYQIYETKISSSCWRKVHHWLSVKLSFWQRPCS